MDVALYRTADRQPDRSGADAPSLPARADSRRREHGACLLYTSDSHTRVSISTVAQKGYYRMWFDDLMIVRDDGGQSEGSSGSGSGGDYGDGGDGFDTEGSASSGGSAGGGSYCLLYTSRCV